MADRIAQRATPTIERRPPVATTAQRTAVAVAPSTARALQQRLGNQGAQALAARMVARSSEPGVTSTISAPRQDVSHGRALQLWLGNQGTQRILAQSLLAPSVPNKARLPAPNVKTEDARPQPGAIPLGARKPHRELKITSVDHVVPRVVPSQLLSPQTVPAQAPSTAAAAPAQTPSAPLPIPAAPALPLPMDEGGGTTLAKEQGASPAALDSAGPGTTKEDEGAGAGAQIADAPAYDPESQAAAKARLIEANCAASEIQVARIAAARRQHVDATFSTVRQGLSGFSARVIAGFRSLVVTKQTEVMATATQVLASVQNVISGMLKGIAARGAQVGGQISAFVRGAVSSVQVQVRTIAREIVGVINSAQLPDVLGIGQIRGLVLGVLNEAAGLVNGALDRVIGVIQSALLVGMQMLSSIFESASELAHSAIRVAASTIQQIVQTVTRTLNSLISLVAGGLDTAMNRTVIPLLNRLELLFGRRIATAERQARGQLRANRKRHIEAIAATLGPQGAHADLDNVAADAVRVNSLIVQSFEVRSVDRIAAAFQYIRSAAAQIVAIITWRVAMVVSRVMSAFGQLVQVFSRLVHAVTEFTQAVMGAAGELFQSVVEFVRSLAQHPIDAIVGFARNAVARMRGFIGGFIRNLLDGLGIGASARAVIGDFTLEDNITTASRGPITKPRPGPIVIPGLKTILFAFLVVGAVVLYLFPSLLSVVAALATLVGPEIAVIIIGMVAVLVVLLILFLLFLLIQYLLKGRPKKPCSIMSRTLVSAPDGSADTRRLVGVNERVEMKAITSATWSASRGIVSPDTGTTTIWTSPDLGGICTITATLSGGSKCSTTMRVIIPDRRVLTRKTDQVYTTGLAGSGWIANVVIHPTKVSFSRIMVREGTVKATATGYYDTVLKWNGAPHPLGSWLPVDRTNSGIEDTVGTRPPGTPTPFSKGTFFWPIPQQYRIAGSGGSGTEFSRGNHVQDMKDATGEETTSKEGATRTRRP